MTPTDFKRKLSAILMADVVGYSRLMGEDEAATLTTLTTYKEIMGSLIRQHRGRVVEAPGDAVLSEFSSVVDAVQCAVSMQKELQARNAELPESSRMQFRIGINLGDVIEEGDKIYGDGVNIAARLEALADPGGICISRTAFDHIETKLPLGYEFLGEKTVKNIARPVGAYRVLLEPRVTVVGEITKEKARHDWLMKALIAGGLVLVAAISLVIWRSGWLSSRPETQAAPPSIQSPSPPLTQVTPPVQVSQSPQALSPTTTTPSPQAAPSPATVPLSQKAFPTPVSPLAKGSSPTPITPPSTGVVPPTRMVPSAQVKEALNFFQKLDQNNDGKVTLEEFMRWREAQFNRLDTNNDGSLSRSEVSAGKNKFARKVMDNFDLIDTNQDQKLSREEFREASRRTFLKFDTNRDRSLNKDELINSMTPQLGQRSSE